MTTPNEEPQVDHRTIAERMVDEIQRIREGLDWLNKTPITLRMIVVLIHDKTKLSKTKIRQVLEAFEETMDELNQPPREVSR